MAAGASTGDFGISKFMSKLENLGGIAKKNKFTVQVTPPTSLVSEIPASKIDFLAKAVTFPARTLGTTTYRSGGRFALNVPYETTYEGMALTLVNTNDHAPRIFWTDWLEHIQGMNSYNMQYYKKFIGQVKIMNFSEEQNLQEPPSANYEVTLHEAYPKGIGAIELGWENSDLQDFEIDIQYSWWTEKSTKPL